MATEILKSFGTLQSELEQAKSVLKGVDENIKRLIGRDPSELVPRPALKRGPVVDDRTRHLGPRPRNLNHENDEPPSKRRNNISVFKRLSERPSHYEEETLQPQRQLISKVIVTSKEIPSRQEALAAQSKDEKFKERNKRMFGALLGTLQKFQQEETKLKSKEEKRAQLEKKIEEHEKKEKDEIKKERQELFLNRKKKQAEIKMIELKMLRMKEYAAWEERQKPRLNYILTKTKPHIHYLPRKLNDANKAALEKSKEQIEKIIDKKRQQVFEELQAIEDRMKRNFEGKKTKDDKQEEDHDDTEEVSKDGVFNDQLSIDNCEEQKNSEVINENNENDFLVDKGEVKKNQEETKYNTNIEINENQIKDLSEIQLPDSSPDFKLENKSDDSEMVTENVKISEMVQNSNVQKDV